jgi:hypothetical protein
MAKPAAPAKSGEIGKESHLDRVIGMRGQDQGRRGGRSQLDVL